MVKLAAMPKRLGGLPRRVQAAPKVAESFYQSREWRELVASIKRERGARCQRRGCERPTHRVIADHIVERKDGGAPLDRRNIELLCFGHHQAKTAEARRRRSRGDGRRAQAARPETPGGSKV
jgi:5-methylcytosine-specific restriction protein A